MSKKNTVGKKLTVRKIDLAKEEPGFEFEGKFMGTATGAPFKQVDKEGNIIEKTLTTAIFEDLETAERFSVIQDAGLRTNLSDAMVKEGQAIRVVKLPKVALKGGRTMNQYDIYAI
ncbi:MAG: hypothetical protein AB7F66_17640 [Bacteriovoracia bacterium]